MEKNHGGRPRSQFVSQMTENQRCNSHRELKRKANDRETRKLLLTNPLIERCGDSDLFSGANRKRNSAAQILSRTCLRLFPIFIMHVEHVLCQCVTTREYYVLNHRVDT